MTACRSDVVIKLSSCFLICLSIEEAILQRPLWGLALPKREDSSDTSEDSQASPSSYRNTLHDSSVGMETEGWHHTTLLCIESKAQRMTEDAKGGEKLARKIKRRGLAFEERQRRNQT
jgi:hypothetical protein